jgi:hypothetical protein
MRDEVAWVPTHRGQRNLAQCHSRDLKAWAIVLEGSGRLGVQVRYIVSPLSLVKIQEQS